MFSFIFTRDKRGKREARVLVNTFIIAGAVYFVEMRSAQILVFVK